MRAERKEEEKNVMPSMVVRQQRLYHGGATEATRFEHQLATPEAPEHLLGPASSGTTLRLMRAPVSAVANPAPGGEPAAATKTFDRDGLVLPKRLTHHLGGGCAPSAGQPIIRDLNRELKFNQVRGKNVLEQKSELKRALEKLEDNRRKKELEQQRLSRRTSLELRLEERAERLAKDSQRVQEEVGAEPKSALPLGRRRKDETPVGDKQASSLPV